MYPHERSLVKRLANRPFVLLGINSDQDRKQLKQVMRKKKITWRSWFDGSTDGPIAKQWNVHGWPTIYVLDHEGVIRYTGVRGDDLDKAVDTLLEPLPKTPRSFKRVTSAKKTES
jgi:hypothetical protein